MPPDRPCPNPSGALVLLHMIEPLWNAFLAEWLGAAGHRVAEGEGQMSGAETPALVLAGHAWPRRGAGDVVQQLRTRWPATPIVLLSPTLAAGAEGAGPLATTLGVQAVAPMPIARERFLALVQRVLANAAGAR